MLLRRCRLIKKPHETGVKVYNATRIMKGKTCLRGQCYKNRYEI
jgi:hypothetical protein